MIRLRRLDRQDAARLSALWGRGEPLIGYHLPSDAAEMAALIDEWNRGEVRGAYFEMLLIEEDGEPAGLVSLFGKGRMYPSVYRCIRACREEELAGERRCWRRSMPGRTAGNA